MIDDRQQDDDIRQRLAEVFESVVADDVEFRDDLTASEVPTWDSLAHVNFIFAIEEQFGIRLADDEVAPANLGELARTIARRARRAE